MKYFIPMIILSLVLLSCAKEEAEEETTITELEGTWKTACYTNSDNTSTSNIDTLTFVGNVLTIKEEKHSDTSCATDYRLVEFPVAFSMGDAVTFANGKTGHKFTLTLGSTIKITPQSDSAVSAFNSGSGECSKTDWVKDTEKECSTGDDAGDTKLCLYQLDGNNWYPKCDDSVYPSTSDIDSSKAEGFFTKQ